MANPGLKSKGEILRAVIDFVFGFKNRKGEVLDHWGTFFDNFSYSPEEFYSAIEKELISRRIPGMEISREEFAEGGLLSERRIYLRLFRERLALYMCAAPFGTGYFFSCRTVYVQALVRLWHIIAAFFFFFFVYELLFRLLGFTYSLLALVTLLYAIAAVFWNAAGAAFSDVDSFLLKIPVVATIYEDWFREDTYYRVDTRIIYVQRIPELIRDLADEITAAKGAKLISRFENAPIFGQLYRTVPPK